MQEYRLTRWPALSARHDRTPYRRLLHAMSQHHVGEGELLATARGLQPPEIARFLQELRAQGVLEERTALFSVSQHDTLPWRSHLRRWQLSLRRRVRPWRWAAWALALGMSAWLLWP